MTHLPADIQRALACCPPLQTVTLEEFLDTLLDEEPEVLARMPGTPGEVLAAQFTCYARQSVPLRECLRRAAEPASRLVQRVMCIDTHERNEKGT
jgi:hypothetical protein